MTPRPRPAPEAPRPSRPPPAAPGRPWWFAIPEVVLRTLWWLAVPLRVAVWAAEAAVTFALLGLGGVVWAWWTGRLPDALVAETLTALGDRILNILRLAGAL